MVGLREIPRTAVFAWAPGAGSPLVVTGTRTGAVSEDFSSEIKLELWDLGLQKLDSEELQPLGSITTDAGFNDIAWGEPDDDHPLGVIAGALESGAIDLWDAEKLRAGSSDAHISRTQKHSGSAKTLQWNPHRTNLLASAGAKGEIFIYDLNNMANPFRLGATAARADDIESLDWNKQEKTAHILATGSSGGFVTIWDVKQKRDILTLNNQGRKAVSAVAWDPEESTKLATATPNDQDPLIFLWSLRNSSAPERVLKGHELGVLGLSWCRQDAGLLLSCGKDNRTICWDPRTGERYGDFAAGSNWAFQTKWNPHNPSLIASASFDGKILITSTQSTNTKTEEQTSVSHALDGEDFFAKAQTQPQGITFSLPIAPRWAGRPASVAFGFGGKLVYVSADSNRKSKLAIEKFEVDKSIGEATASFEEELKKGDLASICSAKIENAKHDEEKADWQVIETLNAGKSRKKLRQYLGFEDVADTKATGEAEKPDINGDAPAEAAKPSSTDDDEFFGSAADGDTFLADLAASKGTHINNPFHVVSDTVSAPDKGITQALILGKFEAALDICLKEDRISDAFMIAVCGGQSCIDKAQSAYLKKKANGPQYLRLLASIVGKNLWDVVHNADLSNWKEVMATLCTYADEAEFSDLCEALGDRLEEAFQSENSLKTLRRDASFCYLAGTKLEKVVNNWVQELEETERLALEQSQEDNNFSVHAKSLQGFIEKVAVFRKVTGFEDAELQSSADWKLAALYSLYAEYADILAAHGQLDTAEQYLNLIPSKFNGAESAQQRIRNATKKTTSARQTTANQRTVPKTQPAAPSFQPVQATQPLINQARNATPSPYTPAVPTVSATPSSYVPAANTYTPVGYQLQQPAAPYGQPATYGGYAPQQPQVVLPPPPRTRTMSPAVPPPSKAKDMSNWNDMPENFLKDRQPPPRRGGTPTPSPSVNSPFPGAAPTTMTPPPPMSGASPYITQKPTPPLPPPPKAGELPPRVISPPSGPPQPAQRVPSATASAYAPAAPTQPTNLSFPAPSPAPVDRVASPYIPAPSTSHAAPSSRYAPAPGTQTAPSYGVPGQRTVAPNPYQSAQAPSPYAPQSQPLSYNQPPPPAAATGPPPRAGPLPGGPPRAAPPPSAQPAAPPPPPSGPPRGGPPRAQSSTPITAASDSRPPTAGSGSAPPPRTKYPRGDRTHIPASAQPILASFDPEISRIKAAAPPTFKPQVDDMEKRINILYDHLNNEDLLAPDTVQQVVAIAAHVQAKEWDLAQAVFDEVLKTKGKTEGGNWLTGVKRLIAFGKATKA